jgi:hypothetical protein
MGFKTAGLPYFAFNSPLFRASVPLWKILQRDCGLTLYTTPFLGKIGKADRDAVPNESLIANGVTYTTFDEINLGTSHTIEFNANLKNLTEVILGDNISTNNFITTFSNSTISYRSGGVSAGFAISTHNENHKYEFVRENLNISLSVDGGVPESKTLSSNNDFLLSSLMAYSGGSVKFTGTLNYLSITKSDGQTLTLNTNTRQDSGIIPLNITDANGNAIGVIEGQQEFSPVIPTEVSPVVETQQDANGMTVAKSLSDNLFDYTKATDGEYFGTSGDIVTTNPNRYLTAPIWCEGETSACKTRESSNVKFLDKEFNQLSVLASPSNPFAIPTEACYLQTYGDTTEVTKELFVVNFGSTLLPHVPYSGYSFRS